MLQVLGILIVGVGTYATVGLLLGGAPAAVGITVGLVCGALASSVVYLGTTRSRPTAWGLEPPDQPADPRDPADPGQLPPGDAEYPPETPRPAQPVARNSRR